jgi:urease accessory protein UreF
MGDLPIDIALPSTEHHAMVRTQVYLSEEQHRALRHAARREGVSMTAFLRRMVERELVGQCNQQDCAKDQEYAKDVVMGLADLGRSGRSGISEHHDRALATALRDNI